MVAHNAKAFDVVFAVKRKLKNELIHQGAKMTVGTWKFIDSLMLLPIPLSAMPKSFALNELKKGYWLFLADKPEYYQYEGPLLEKELYCGSDMKSKPASDFHKWHDEQTANGYVFNFRRELIDYCISDVTILRQACTALRELFEEKAGHTRALLLRTVPVDIQAKYGSTTVVHFDHPIYFDLRTK